MQQQRRPMGNPGNNVRRDPNRINRPHQPGPANAGSGRVPQRQGGRPSPRPGGRPPQRQGQRPNQRPAQRPQPPRQNAPREWIYPEGYTPPKGYRPPAQRPVQRKPVPKKKPKQDYTFLWVFLGQLGLRLVIGMLVGMAVIGLLYRGKFYGNPEDKRDNVVYTFSKTENEKEEVQTFEVGAASAYRGEDLMVSCSDIAAWLDMAQVGDIHTMRFVCREGDSQSVVFHYNSHNAFIGHEIVVMDCETRFAGGEVWVPLSFVQGCMKGFDVTVEGSSVKITRNADIPGFTLHASEPIAPCEYPE